MLYQSDSIYDAKHGYDVKHLPSLDSMGLWIILEHDANAAVPVPSSLSSTYLASFTSSPNPFTNGLTLRFILNRMSYTYLGIFDELGHQVWSDVEDPPGQGKGSSLESGVHEIHIDGNAFPNGTYFARISTGFGEVNTLKLIHEK